MSYESNNVYVSVINYINLWGFNEIWTYVCDIHPSMEQFKEQTFFHSFVLHAYHIPFLVESGWRSSAEMYVLTSASPNHVALVSFV